MPGASTNTSVSNDYHAIEYVPADLLRHPHIWAAFESAPCKAQFQEFVRCKTVEAKKRATILAAKKAAKLKYGFSWFKGILDHPYDLEYRREVVRVCGKQWPPFVWTDAIRAETMDRVRETVYTLPNVLVSLVADYVVQQ